MAMFWKKIFPKENQYEPLVSTDEETAEAKEIKLKNTVYHNKISSFNAFWNISNSIQGVAILAMPYVVKGGGWWSVLGIAIIALVSNYTGQILIDCHYEEVTNEMTGEVTRLRTRGSYAEIGAVIFPKYGKNTVMTVQVLELLFMATLYPVVFVSVMRNLFSEWGLSFVIWISIFGIFMLPNVFFRQLHHISIMSSLTVASATAVFLAVCMYCFTEVSNWQMKNMERFSPKEFVASLGVVIASYSSQMYLSVIEADMREPGKIARVMNGGYASMTLLKIGIGVIAYMTFGASTSQVVTLNLPPGVLLTGVNIVVIILAMSSYTLPMFTVFEILEQDTTWFVKGNNVCDVEKEAEEENGLKMNKRRIVIRIALVLCTLIMAATVPHFCLLLSFIGSFTGTFLEMVFPCCFYLILKFDRLSKWSVGLNIVIICSSLFFMVIGMYLSAMSIVKAFKLHTKEAWTVE